MGDFLGANGALSGLFFSISQIFRDLFFDLNCLILKKTNGKLGLPEAHIFHLLCPSSQIRSGF